MITDKNLNAAKELQCELRYLIGLLKKNNLNYLDTLELETAIKGIDLDIEDFQRKQESICPALKVGAIIQIPGGDGFSVHIKEYYLVKDLSDLKIRFDKIVVKMGESENEIKVIRDIGVNKKEWIKKYNNNSEHEDNISKETWNKLLKYAENIPWY